MVTVQSFDAGWPIVVQGEAGSHVYFLEEGAAKADVDGRDVMSYEVGDYFG